ncbi:MAG TPA: hypothetical protein VIX18_11305, partial [Nitrospirota bacterium]
MRNEDLNGLAESFSEIEKRVKALASENRDLKKRVNGLEEELALTRREAQQAEHARGKHLHIREKVERVLRSLDALGAKETGEG